MLKEIFLEPIFVGILFTWIYSLVIVKVYYLSYFIVSKSIYLNQMHIQRYINLEKYTCFITLDIFQKYSYPKLGIFSKYG
jgi:hypothetical protein